MQDCKVHYARPLNPVFTMLGRQIDKHETLYRAHAGVRTCTADGPRRAAPSDAVCLCAAAPLPLLPSLQPSDAAPEACMTAAIRLQAELPHLVWTDDSSCIGSMLLMRQQENRGS